MILYEARVNGHLIRYRCDGSEEALDFLCAMQRGGSVVDFWRCVVESEEEGTTPEVRR